MKRGLLAAAILGLTAIPANAGDTYAPYPGCGTYTTNGNAGPVYQPLTNWHAGVFGTGGCGTCNTCGSTRDRERERSMHERLQKFKEFLCYKPTIPCDPRPIPSPYIQPLRTWFPRRPDMPCGCDIPGVTHGVLGRRYAPCGTCGSCAACGTNAHAMPAIAAVAPIAPLSPLMAAPTATARSNMIPDPAVTQQSYKVSKPANSNALQPLLPAAPAANLPGSYVPQRN